VEVNLSSENVDRLRVGVVGTGALGHHHVRILSGHSSADLVGLYDSNPTVAQGIADEYATRRFDSLESLAAEVDACVVAVPTVDHAWVGCYLLGQGIHTLVEKPLAPSLEEADQLLQSAADRVLAVGHVEYYNPAVQALLDLGGETGFVEIDRLAVFSPRSLDIDVVLDLMIHDLQILHAIDSSPVTEIRAKGIAVLSEKIDIANARIALGSGCVANLTASRVSADRVRKLRVFKPEHGYYSVDYHEQSIKGFRIERSGGETMIVPDTLEIVRSEPLKEELDAFIAACRGEKRRVVLGDSGKRALKTALEIVEAIKETG